MMYFWSLLRLAGQRPFEAGRETAAAAAAQAGLLDLVDHLFRRHLFQDFIQGGKSVVGDIFFQAVEIDLAAVFQDNFLLAVEKADVVQMQDPFAGPADP